MNLKNNFIFLTNINIWQSLRKTTSWVLHTYWNTAKLKLIHTNQRNVNADMSTYSVKTDTSNTNIKYSYFLQKKNTTIRLSTINTDNINYYSGDWLQTLRNLKKNKHSEFYDLKSTKSNPTTTYYYYSKIPSSKLIKAKTTDNDGLNIYSSYDIEFDIPLTMYYKLLRYFYSRFFKFIFKSDSKKINKEYLNETYCDDVVDSDIFSDSDLELNWREEDLSQIIITNEDINPSPSSVSLNWSFLLNYNQYLKITDVFYTLSKLDEFNITTQPSTESYNPKMLNLITKLDLQYNKTLTTLRSSSIYLNLNKISKKSILSQYVKIHKNYSIKKINKLQNYKCLSILYQNIVNLNLYHDYLYINDLETFEITPIDFSDQWGLNNFLNNKGAVFIDTFNCSRRKLFTYYFNISSYKLFFNIILLFPFLLINYSSKTIFLNKLFYKNTQFKLSNPSDDGADKIVAHHSIYIEVGSFLETFTGKNVNLLIYKNSFSDITNLFKIILNVWVFRIKHFYRTFNNKFDLSLVIKLLYLSIKNKDIHLLMKLITLITPRIEFKKQRKFFKFIIFMFRTYFSLLYPLYNIQGYQFEFRGKISVDGNARTRKMYAKILRPSPSNYSYSTRYIYKTVNTYTGVLGLKIWIYYSH